MFGIPLIDITVGVLVAAFLVAVVLHSIKKRRENKGNPACNCPYADSCSGGCPSDKR